jgi:acetolactate synthase small subunit
MLKNEENNLFNKLILINNYNLIAEKEEIVKEINLFRNKYLDIDKQFNLEIEKNIKKINYFSWLKT